VRERETDDPCPLKILVPDTTCTEWLKFIKQAFGCEEVSSIRGLNLLDIDDDDVLEQELSLCDLIFLDGCKKKVVSAPLSLDLAYPRKMDEYLVETIREIVHAVASKASACSKKEFRECFLSHHVHEFYNADTYASMLAPKRYLTHAVVTAFQNAHMNHPDLCRYEDDFFDSAMITKTKIAKEPYSIGDRIARFIKCEIEKAREAYRGFLNNIRSSKKVIQPEDKYRFFSELTTTCLHRLFYCPENGTVSGHDWLFKNKCQIPQHPSGAFIGKSHYIDDEDDLFGTSIVVHEEIKIRTPWELLKDAYTTVVVKIQKLIEKQPDRKVVVIWSEHGKPYVYCDHNNSCKIGKKKIKFESEDDHGDSHLNIVTNDTRKWLKDGREVASNLYLVKNVPHQSVIFLTDVKARE
jgi:hypothetical protein